MSKTKRVAQEEVFKLLRRAGRKQLSDKLICSLLEEVSQAVGLDQRRTDRLLRATKRAMARRDMPDLKPGDTIWVKNQECKVAKLTEKSVAYEDEDGNTRRIGKTKLFRTTSVVCDAPSLKKVAEHHYKPLEGEE